MYITIRRNCIRKYVILKITVAFMLLILFFPILNCFSMFIFVYNSVRALGTLGSVLDQFYVGCCTVKLH